MFDPQLKFKYILQNYINMNLLSIDVGIKNLSFCQFTVTGGNYTIKDWGIINIAEDQVHCHFCNKPAGFSQFSYNEHYCKKHVPKKCILVDKKFLNMDKVKMTDFKRIGMDFQTREECINAMTNHSEGIILPILKVNASHVNLVEVSRQIQKKFDEKWEGQQINKVIIENQIGPIAIRMKAVQGMLTQYFIKNVPDIHFISSSNKLKGSGKLTYVERKKEGIRICLEKLESTPEWIPYFQSHLKKDDLADCFLQGLWFIANKQEK